MKTEGQAIREMLRLFGLATGWIRGRKQGTKLEGLKRAPSPFRRRVLVGHYDGVNPGVRLEFGQIVERIGSVQLAG